MRTTHKSTVGHIVCDRRTKYDSRGFTLFVHVQGAHERLRPNTNGRPVNEELVGRFTGPGQATSGEPGGGFS